VRLVLDTNTALSGLLWPGGPPGRLIDAAEIGRIELCSSPALLAELIDVIGRDKFAQPLAKRGIAAAALFDGYAALVRLVTPAHVPRVIERDPDDDHVIACALSARADWIVSGDRHLLDLGRSFHGVRILKAAEAVADLEMRHASD
jgi:putative PIN family toxin of toxin-antitoxin system